MKKLILIMSIIALSGCMKTMPDNFYPQFGSFLGPLQKCFEQEYIAPQLYAEARTALSYQLGTWKYDKARMSNMINQSYTGYVTKSSCRQVEANCHRAIANVKRHVESEKEWARLNSNNSGSKMVFCNTIGTMTICN